MLLIESFVGVPRILMISTSWSRLESPANMGVPSSASATTHADDHTSIAGVYWVAPKMSSAGGERTGSQLDARWEGSVSIPESPLHSRAR